MRLVTSADDTIINTPPIAFPRPMKSFCFCKFLLKRLRTSLLVEARGKFVCSWPSISRSRRRYLYRDQPNSPRKTKRLRNVTRSDAIYISKKKTYNSLPTLLKAKYLFRLECASLGQNGKGLVERLRRPTHPFLKVSASFGGGSAKALLEIAFGIDPTAITCAGATKIE